MPDDAVLPASAFPGLRHRHHQQTAIITRGGSLSVGGLLERATRMSAEIRRRFPSGFDGSSASPCILIPSQDPLHYVSGLFACLHSGAQFVPLRLGADVEQLAATVMADGILMPDTVGSSSNIECHWEGGARSYSSEVVMLTSGSTGMPKGVALDLNSLILNATVAGARMEVGRCDAWSVSIDLGLMSGLCHFLMAWQYQLPFYCLNDSSDVEISKLFSERAVGYGGGPLQLLQLAQRQADTPPAMMVSSGDFFPAESIAHIRDLLPSTALNKLYGLTEVSGRMCCLTDEELDKSPSAAGYPLPGFQLAVRTADEGIRRLPSLTDGDSVCGEILVASPMLFAGYHQLKSGFDPRLGDWFATGDHGSMDSAGLVTLHGRTDDVFKVGGEKVNRNEIETALAPLLAGIPYVVLPLENRLLGHCPVLFVAGVEEPCIPGWAEIVAYLRGRVPPRFIPIYMYRVDPGLPLLGSGKIDKQTLIANHEHYTKISI